VSVLDVPGAQVLVRALNLLLLLRERGEPVPVAELAETLGLPQSNLYRLLQTLESAGLVDRNTPGHVQLGLQLLDLGSAVEQRIEADVVPVAAPVMGSLTRALELTSLLTMRAGSSAVCVHAVESRRPIRLSFAPGRHVPLFGGASGRILLPWAPEGVLRRLLAQQDSWTMASGQVLTTEAIATSLAEARASGYMITRGEVDPGVAAIAAPVLLPDGRLWAGLSVAGPEEQFPPSRVPEMAAAVREHAGSIARALRPLQA
jgi:IclR family transcriptional regulator, KDG regulon repressor